MVIKRRLKNFSRSNGRDLIENFTVKRFSIIGVEEQRDFGKIDRFAKNLTKKIGKSIAKDINKKKKAINDAERIASNSTKDPKVMENIGKEAQKLKTKTIKGKKKDNIQEGLREDSWKYDSKNTSSKAKQLLTKYGSPQERELGKALIENEHVINHKGSQASYAHEVGHLKNKRGGPISRLISWLNDKTSPSYKENIKNDKGSALENLVKGSILVKEEENASKNGVKLLKDSGASLKDIAEGKFELNKSLQTYKSGRNIATKKSLGRFIKRRSGKGRKK